MIKAKTTLFLDESGYTGADYVNRDQPFFVLGCNWMAESNLTVFNSMVTASYRGQEIKFGKLVKTGNGTKLLKEITAFLGQHQDEFCIYIVDKKSALVRKFVDDCIDPAMTELGHTPDYKERWAYANLFSTTMPAFMGLEWYGKFLEKYNALIREKDLSSLELLWQHCSLCESNSDAMSIISPFLTNRQAAWSEINRPGYKADIFETLILGLIIHCRNHFGIKTIDVTYDLTKAVTDLSLSDFVKQVERLPRMFKLSQVCSIYPDVKIGSVNGVDSKSCVGVMLSDVLAGLANWTFKRPGNIDSELGKAFLGSLADRNFIHMINSSDVTPETLGLSGGESPWESNN
jgi:hypothetical protein